MHEDQELEENDDKEDQKPTFDLIHEDIKDQAQIFVEEQWAH
jgi:hypothetical protein